jgi:hypothetical protein
VKYAVEMGSGAIIPSFIKIGSGFRKLMRRGGFTDMQTAYFYVGG